MGLTILTIAILALVALFTSGLRLKTRLSQVTVATEIARETLERTKSMGFAALPTGPAFFDGSLPTPLDASGFPPFPYPTRTVEGRIYTVSARVDEVVGRSRLKTVLVEVSWGDQSQVRLATQMVDL